MLNPAIPQLGSLSLGGVIGPRMPLVEGGALGRMQLI